MCNVEPYKQGESEKRGEVKYVTYVQQERKRKKKKKILMMKIIVEYNQ